MKPTNRLLLPVIVFAQFAGTSLWFAGNAIINDIQQQSGAGTVANITSFVQFGFIAGTLCFAVFTIADRYRASAVFLFCSLIAASANAGLIFFVHDLTMICLLRFITGFFLAGIYPVGMKIAADMFPEKLGKALGFLVGALVLGTAFPHLLKSGLFKLPWKSVLVFTSLLALLGGLVLFLFVPKGIKKTGMKFRANAFLLVFGSKDFRSAAFGYFGHMWELYTFWAFIPLILQKHDIAGTISVSLWSFFIIAIGFVSCIAGGLLSRKTGSKKVAFYSLLLSGCCCAMAPFSYQLPHSIFFAFLLFWGATVVSDSPQFSALVVKTAIPEYKGTALTIVTSIGFTITIASIQLMKLYFAINVYYLWLLVPGPLLGVMALMKTKSSVTEN